MTVESIDGSEFDAKDDFYGFKFSVNDGVCYEIDGTPLMQAFRLTSEHEQLVRDYNDSLRLDFMLESLVVSKLPLGVMREIDAVLQPHRDNVVKWLSDRVEAVGEELCCEELGYNAAFLRDLLRGDIPGADLCELLELIGKLMDRDIVHDDGPELPDTLRYSRGEQLWDKYRRAVDHLSGEELTALREYAWSSAGADDILSGTYYYLINDCPIESWPENMQWAELIGWLANAMRRWLDDAC